MCSKNVVIKLSSFKYPSLSIRTNILRWADKQIFLATVLWILPIVMQFLLFYSPQLQSQVWILNIRDWPIAKSSLILFITFRPFFSFLFFDLREQPHLFHNATTGFPAKWSLRNKHRNSILMACHLINYAQVWVVLLVSCEQRLHFCWVSCHAKSSLCWQPFNFLSCMRKICLVIRKQNSLWGLSSNGASFAGIKKLWQLWFATHDSRKTHAML